MNYTENKPIYGGAFQLARKIFSSEIWLEKPSTWKIIWIYILGKVNHQNNGKFNRGEGFFNLTIERQQIGNDITYDMIRHAITYFKKNQMLSTMKSTRGMIIKVLNYDKYQTLQNFKSTMKSTIRAQSEHNESTTINKNDKNVKNEKNDNNSEQSSPTLQELLIPYKEKYDTNLIEAFTNYWTEKNLNGKKERWQMQKIFDPARRLATWASRDWGKKQRGILEINT